MRRSSSSASMPIHRSPRELRAERDGEERAMTVPREDPPTALRPLLDDAAAHAAGFLEGLPERSVAPTATAGELREALGGPLPGGPRDPRRVVAELARATGHPLAPGAVSTP